MARRASLYPPSPEDVPADLTACTPKFRFHAFVVLFSLFVFFAIYLTLLIGSAWLVYWCYGPRVNRANAALWILGFFAALLCLFLVKGFFKRHRREKSFDIEVAEDEQPKLFDFIDRLCDEINAPRPKRVYVNFEVNASAAPETTFLSIFWSRAKELRIGLGLVNFLNLTEFKALLAHEFGHFSQNTMKIGGYVYMTRRIVGDIVFGRDFLDDMLARWRCLDIRVAWLGWLFSAMIWVLRKILELLYRAIFFLDKALSREMEFNADLVAVSVTGSDAPCHLLAKSCFANTCLNQALGELSDAADHHLYSANLFYHQTRTVPFLRRIAKKPDLGELPPLPENVRKTTQIFHADDEEDVPVMWLEHPTNFDRERNAKAEYIRSEFDERPAWLLFENPDDIRERVSYRFYRIAYKVSKDVVLAGPEEVQSFIDEEHAETTYDTRYHGVYDNRNLDPGDLTELAALARTRNWARPQLVTAHTNLYGVEVKHRIQRYNGRIEEFNLLQAIVDKRHKPKNNEIEFREDVYDSRDAKKLLKKVDRELGEDNEFFKGLDRDVFLVHYQMALHVAPGAGADLLERYRFHLGLQKIWRELRTQEGPLNWALGCLEQGSRVEQGLFQEILGIFREAQKKLSACLDDADKMTLPALKNMTPGAPLGKFLLPGKLVKRLRDFDQQITGKWITNFLNQFSEVRKKVDRVHFKSLGQILAMQEDIARRISADSTPARPDAGKPPSPSWSL